MSGYARQKNITIAMDTVLSIGMNVTNAVQDRQKTNGIMSGIAISVHRAEREWRKQTETN